MRFPDDKDKDKEKEKENINGAECERKQGNDEGSSLQLIGQNVNENKAMTKVRHCKKSTRYRKVAEEGFTHTHIHTHTRTHAHIHTLARHTYTHSYAKKHTYG